MSESQREPLTALALSPADGVDNKIVAQQRRATLRAGAKPQARFPAHRFGGLLAASRQSALRGMRDAQVDGVSVQSVASRRWSVAEGLLATCRRIKVSNEGLRAVRPVQGR